MDTYQSQQKNKIITILVTLVVVVGLVVVIDQLNGGSTASATNAVSTSQPATNPTSSSQSSSTPAATNTPTASNAGSGTPTSSFKDGTYTVTTEYYVPNGYEDIKVTLSVAGGKVTGSNIINSEGNRESAYFQRDFASAYRSYVVGKKIDSLNLSVISGASDTTNGFNAALDKIRQQAQA